MSDLIFEPLAVRQLWQLPQPVSGDVWRELLCAYAAALARALIAEADGRHVLIGHIKLLAMFPGEGYLRISAVDVAHAPTCDGHAPDGLAEISITANVLVYGLELAVLERSAWENAFTVAALWRGQVVERKEEGERAGGEHPLRRSHHHDTIDAD